MLAEALPGVRLEGLDLEEAMVATARAMVADTRVADRVSYAVADVRALPYATGTVDLVVSTASLHHWSDPAAGVQELARVLTPSGMAVIYDPNAVLRQACALAEAAGLTARADSLGFGIGRLTLRRAT